jgi:hypothetical protein
VIGDVLLGMVRLAHALAAATWVGGAVIFSAAPSLGRGLAGTDSQRVRDVLRGGVAVFVLTGAIMTFERLGSAPVPPTYFAVLTAKVAIAAWMFAIARGVGKREARGGDPARRLLVLGLLVYALAIVLRNIYEHAIRM